MSPESYIQAQLVSFAHYTASHLGADSMLAAAGLIRNRVRAGWFGGDWLEVLSRAQEVAAHPPANPLPFRMSDPAVQRLLREVDDIFALAPAPDDFLRGGLYCFDPIRGGDVTPWFKHTIMDRPHQHRRVAQVGMLWIFS